MVDQHKQVLVPRRGWSRLDFGELFRYKDLMYFMVLRDVTVLYKQSILGYAWAIINPVFSMVVFSIVFGKLAGVPSDGVPYPLFSYAALIPWTYFSNALNTSGTSLVTNANLLTKVYFPRIIIPLTPVLSKLVDFSISLILLFVMVIYYEYPVTLRLFLLPILVLIMLTTTAGLGMMISALTIQYRDVKFALTFVLPLLMYGAPVVFSTSLIREKFGEAVYQLYGMYPMAGVIDGFRAMVIPTNEIPWILFIISGVSSIIFLGIGSFIFGRMERKFADVA